MPSQAIQNRAVRQAILIDIAYFYPCLICVFMICDYNGLSVISMKIWYVVENNTVSDNLRWIIEAFTVISIPMDFALDWWISKVIHQIASLDLSMAAAVVQDAAFFCSVIWSVPSVFRNWSLITC